MSWSLRCPACQSPIEGELRRFGLVRRLPPLQRAARIRPGWLGNGTGSG